MIPNSNKKILKYCSPSKEKNTFTCFSKRALKKIANKWNKSYKKNKIIFDDNTSKEKLWNGINNKLKKQCTHEYCWTKQKFIKKNSLKKYFRPVKPKSWKKNNKEWLSTLDILRVMKQYEKKYNNFIFIGAVPIDFDKKLGFGQCVIDELCKINIKSLIKKGKTKIGIVFNLDSHDKPGSHWVSFFGDLDKEKLYYYDSYGYEPPNEVNVLMERLQSQGEKIEKDLKIFKNNIRHQYKSSECGTFCMNFIIEMLKNTDFDTFIKNNVNDDVMNANRDIYYLDEDNV